MKARLNPFASNRIHQKIRYNCSAGTTMQDLLRRLQHLRYRAAIVGPKGSGKTTLLEDLASNLSRKFPLRWVRLTQEDRKLPKDFCREIGEQQMILIDGADLLSSFEWKWILWKTRKCAGLIVTSHKKLLLPLLISCKTTSELLFQITSTLTGISDPELQKIVGDLFEKHQGNVRDALRELYDVWAMFPEPPCTAPRPAGTIPKSCASHFDFLRTSVQFRTS